MTAGGLKLKLTAVLNANIKGCSRIMGNNEETNVQNLRDAKWTSQ
jgi:hypothetical protein